MIKMIVAMTKDGLVGKGNKLPWNIKEELEFFKKITMNHYLVMGDVTFKGLPNDLPGRKVIVLSRGKLSLGFKTVNNFEEAVTEAGDNDLFIAGGKSIYEQFFDKAEEIYVSEIKNNYKGDVYLNIDLSNHQKELFKEFKEFNVYKYTKGQHNG